jgi:hypothetical protein
VAIPSGIWVSADELTGPVGQGGMDEVYRARDHHLQRNVARAKDGS